MRTKVVLPALAVSIMLIAFAFVLHQRDGNASGALPATQSAVSVPASQPQLASQRVSAKHALRQPEVQPIQLPRQSDSSQDGHAGVAASRIAELNRLAMTSDPRSLDAILSELSNRDRQIRMAAVSATIDFGSPDAIPALQNAMGWTDDLKEKVEIQRAIDFLQLPSAPSQDHKSEAQTDNK